MIILSALASEAIFAIAAAVTILIPASVAAVGMSVAISRAIDGIARQPEADGKIRTTLILGLVFLETAIIYALVIGILLVINLL